MLANYAIKLIDRTDPGTYHTFTRGTDIETFSFGFTDPGGCADFSFRGALTDWSSIEALMIPENLVEISVDVGSGLGLVYTGLVQRVDGPDNTPPGHVVRSVSGYGLSVELKKGGVTVLDGYENMTVEAIVEDLVTTHIGPNTDILTSTLVVTAGSGYTIPRTLFIDTPAEDCIKKLAEVAGGGGDITWGVNNSRYLFFAAKNTSTVLTLQQGDKDSGVTVSRYERGTPGPNAYIITGKEARHGNPMSIREEDIESGGRLREVTLRAPSLIEGDDMVAYAQYLIDRDRDAPVNITVDCVGIEDKLSSIVTASGRVALLDKDAGSIGTFDIKAVTYSLHEGVLDAKFELGDDYEPDPSETLRDLIRDTIILDSSEFMNQTEIDADTDGFGTDARILMAQNGIRNVVCYDFEGKLDLIDWEQESSDYTKGVRADRSDAGLSSQRGAQNSATFGTLPIPQGKNYNTVAILRKCVYPALFRDDMSGDLFGRFLHKPWDQPYPVLWEAVPYGTEPDQISEVRPYIVGPGVSGVDFGGLLRHDRPVTDGVDYLLRFRWGEPAGGSSTVMRYFMFKFQDTSNYACVQMFKNGSNITFYLAKKVAGSWSYVGSAHTLAYSANDICLLTVDCHSYANLTRNVGIRLDNETADTHAGFYWSAANALDNVPGDQCGLASWLDSTLNPGEGNRYYDTWGIRTLTFANAIETGTMPGWQVSRDGGYSLDSEEFEVDAGTPQNMGAYAGGGTEETSLIVRGVLIYPQILTKMAVGWRNTS